MSRPDWPAGAPEPRPLVAFAETLADTAREIIGAHFRRPVEVSYKPDRTPVTEIDRAVERALCERIRRRYPEHGIYGEEYGEQAGTGHGLGWVIDPIDGTKAFMTGKPLFGTLIGLLWEGRPVAGVLEVPALAERWVGARGRVTTVNGAACATRGTRELAAATLHATTIDMFEGGAERESFDALGQAVRFRLFGGDCYNYGLLASGFVDLVVEASLKPYDYLALVPIIEGAGGSISDWEGGALTLASRADRVLGAATPELHRAAQRVLDARPDGPVGGPTGGPNGGRAAEA